MRKFDVREKQTATDPARSMVELALGGYYVRKA